MKKLIVRLALATAVTMWAGIASAHTVALGYVPGANAGDVTFWVGNYTHSGVPGNVANEGSLRLSGQNGNTYGPTTILFDLNTTTKPLGLADGTNYFYASGNVGQAGNPLVGDYSLSYITDCPACGPVTGWQGVAFSGLSVGDYMFEFIEQANPTQDWTEWNDSLNNIFTLLEGDVGGGGPSVVPLPAALPLYAAGLAVMGLLGWRKRQKISKA
jgi:hypothetical protein